MNLEITYEVGDWSLRLQFPMIALPEALQTPELATTQAVVSFIGTGFFLLVTIFYLSHSVIMLQYPLHGREVRRSLFYAVLAAVSTAFFWYLGALGIVAVWIWHQLDE